MNKFGYYLAFLLVRVAVAETPKNFWICPIKKPDGWQIELDLNLEQMKYTVNGKNYDFRQKLKSKNQRLFYVMQLNEEIPPVYEAVFGRTSKKISLYEYFKGSPKSFCAKIFSAKK